MPIGTPSSGVKPIVVSMDAPSATAVTDAPPPRWQTTSRCDRDAFGGPRDGEAVEAEATDAVVAEPLGQGVGAGDLGDRPVERRVEDRDVRHVRKLAARVLDRVERRRIVQRRELDEGVSSATTASSIGVGSREPLAAVHDSVADRVDAGAALERGDDGRSLVDPSTTT